MVAGFDREDARSNAFHNSAGLMSQDAWKQALWVKAVESVDVGVTELQRRGGTTNIKLERQNDEICVHVYQLEMGSATPPAVTILTAFAITLTRTSPALGGSTVISSQTRGVFGARATWDYVKGAEGRKDFRINLCSLCFAIMERK